MHNSTKHFNKICIFNFNPPNLESRTIYAWQEKTNSLKIYTLVMNENPINKHLGKYSRSTMLLLFFYFFIFLFLFQGMPIVVAVIH